MSRRSASPKSRPVAAVVIVAATVFLLLGRSCGVLGALVTGSVDRLLGASGLGLLCVTAWTLAFILATPPGTLTRMVVALWRACVTPRHRVVVTVRTPEAAFVEPPHTALAPRARQQLDAVRSALKNLDYEKHEYEPIVAQMDPTLPFERLVKDALKKLRVN